MAIKVILAKEQYAALNFCRCRYDGLNTQINNHDQKIITKQQKNNLNLKTQVKDRIVDKAPDSISVSKNKSQEQELLDLTIPQQGNLSEFKFFKYQNKKKKTPAQMHFDSFESHQEQKTQTSNFQAKQYKQFKENFIESMIQNKISKMLGDDDSKDEQVCNNESQQQEKNPFDFISNINYLQEMDKIDFDSEFQKNKVDKFIQNIKANENISQIDINIYNSLIHQTYQNQLPNFLFIL
ncbi:hypothetical protein ABPG72_000179 [Tetrahymena utriculariae]